MRVDGLEQPENNPDIHGYNVQLSVQSTEDDGDADRTKSEDHGFEGRRILCSQAEWGAVLMVQLVDEFVQSGGVQSAVKPVVPCILTDEKDGDLPRHGRQRREGNRSRQAKVLGQRVEEPDLR